MLSFGLLIVYRDVYIVPKSLKLNFISTITRKRDIPSHTVDQVSNIIQCQLLLVKGVENSYLQLTSPTLSSSAPPSPPHLPPPHLPFPLYLHSPHSLSTISIVSAFSTSQQHFYPTLFRPVHLRDRSSRKTTRSSGRCLWWW